MEENQVYTIENLKVIAIKEFWRRGRTGSTRWYYGKKDVIEFPGFQWEKFWNTWRIMKDQIKEIGYGVIKPKNYNEFIIFCEIEKIYEFEKEFAERFNIPLEPSWQYIGEVYKLIKNRQILDGDY